MSKDAVYVGIHSSESRPAPELLAMFDQVMSWFQTSNFFVAGTVQGHQPKNPSNYCVQFWTPANKCEIVFSTWKGGVMFATVEPRYSAPGHPAPRSTELTNGPFS